MELSVFLAELLGIYMLIMTLDVLFRRKELDKAVKELVSSKALLVLSGSLSLLAGLAIVIGHPIYTFDWRGLITFLGYLSIIRGILRVSFPSMLQKILLTMFRKGYWAIICIMLVLSLYLTYAGFNH